MFKVNMDKVGGKHLKASEIRGIIGEKKWKTYFKFSLVRNPWDRIGSLYNQPAFKDINFLSGKSLKYFLSNYQPKQHEHGFTCSDYLDEDIDFIGKLEEREEAIKSIFKRVKNRAFQTIKSRHYSRKSANQSRPWHTYFTLEDFYNVKNLYHEDIQRFGYDTEKYFSKISGRPLD